MALPRDVANSGERPKSIGDQQERGALDLAWGHAMVRNGLVARTFCYLSVMRASGLIAAGSKVLISPDSIKVPQDFHASENNQAAHYLPGFVAIQFPGGAPNKARCLWEFVANERVGRDIEDMFRKTQDLNVSFNRADSAAEAKRLAGPPGLKQLFGECCQMAINEHPPSLSSGERLIVVDRPMVARVFAHWAQGSISAYQHAAGRKKALMKRNRPGDVRDEPRTDLTKGVFREWTPEDLHARMRDQGRVVQGRKGTVQEFSDQESFLRAYANVTSGGFPLAESEIQKIEAPFSGQGKPDWFVAGSQPI